MRHGMSLVEVLVACVVGGLLLAALARVFASSSNVFRLSMARADLQRGAVSATAAMAAELRRTAYSVLTIHENAIAFRPQEASPAAVSFVPAPEYVIYYHSAGRLFRKTWGRAPAETVVLFPSPLLTMRRLTPDELERICARPNGTERVLAGNVERLEVDPPAYPTLTTASAVRVTLALRTLVGSEPIAQSVSTAVSMRNRL